VQFDQISEDNVVGIACFYIYVYIYIYIYLFMYNRTPIIRINWDGEPPGYAENTDNLDFSLKIVCICCLQFGCYYLQYVPESQPFDHA